MIRGRAIDEHNKRIANGWIPTTPPPPTAKTYETSTYGKRQANRLKTPGKTKTKGPTPGVRKKKSPPKSATKAGRSLQYLSNLGLYMDTTREEVDEIFW